MSGRLKPPGSVRSFGDVQRILAIWYETLRTGVETGDTTGGATSSASGVPTTLTVSGGLVTAITKTTPVADGTYDVHNDGVTAGQVTDFTVTNGIITAISVLP